MRMVWPTASVVAPNNWSLTTVPSTATFIARATWSASMKMPDCTGQLRSAASSAPTPCTCDCQLPPADSTCVRVLSPGDTALTPATSLATAAASSSISVVTAPCPVRTPPTLAEPALTVTMFVPRLETWRLIEARAPPPIAIITITAATPMMMPSEVSAERRRLRPMASNAVRTVLVAVVIDRRRCCERRLPIRCVAGTMASAASRWRPALRLPRPPVRPCR